MMELKWTALLLLLAAVPSVYGDQDLLNEIRHKEAEWAKKRVWQPELPAPVGETRPVTCRVVSYGGKWTRHGLGGHGGGGCMFRYSSSPAYDPFPGIKDRGERKNAMLSPIRYDVDGDGDKNDDFVAALTFSLDERLSILDWPQSGTFPWRYSAKFYGGYGWYVSDATPDHTHYIQEIGINADHSPPWRDTRAEDHPLNGAANEKIASSGLRFYFVPIWKKDDFLNGGDRYSVTLDETSFFGSLCTRNYWIGFDDVRYVVQEGDQLYISDNKQYHIREGNWDKDEPGSLFAFRPAKATWAKYDPKGHIMHFDPTGAAFETREFNDLRAVGWYLAKNGLKGKLAHCKWYGAEFKATVNQPKSLKSVNVAMQTIPSGGGVPEFSISTCEIPYLLWREIWKWGDSPHYTLDQRYVYAKTGDMGAMRFGNKAHGPDEPVTNLNWYDTLAWCNTLSEIEGKTPCYYEDPEFRTVFRNMHQGTFYEGRINPKLNAKPEPVVYVKWDADGHRLPTPAEWKQAAGRGGKVELGDSTANVGTVGAGENGLYDMFGNVWELVWTHGDAYDPKGHNEIVAVGGSFHGVENAEAFSASPYGDIPFDGHHAVGFRIVGRESGLNKPAQGDVSGTPAWTMREGERLPASSKADPVGPGVMETVKVPAGSYKNGKQTIQVSEMHMGKTEVSFAQWEKVRHWAEANRYEFDTIGDMGSMYFFAYEHSPAEPVVRVRWNDMLVWCNALSEMEGRTPVYYVDEEQTKVYRKAMKLRPPKTDGWDLIRPGGSEKISDAHMLSYSQILLYPRWDVDGYRLPTWAEMTYVRGRVRWGRSADVSTMDRLGWHMQNAGGRTHPVAGKQPNQLGLYDLFGNVYEWIWDNSGLKGHTLRAKLNTNNPKNGMFWPWEEADLRNYPGEKNRAMFDKAFKYAGTNWASSNYSGASWLVDNPEGDNMRPQVHYADVGFRVVRNDAGVQPRDGRYPWDELPKMLDLAGKKFELNAGKVWRGDNNRSGVYPAEGVRELKGVRWTYDTRGKLTSSPLVVDGKLYIGTTKGVVCLNAVDGSVVWDVPIDGGSDSSACWYDGMIFIGGNDSQLHALKAGSGETVWTAKATSPLKSSPCVAYGVVFCGAGTGVSIEDGTPVWGANRELGPISQDHRGRLTSPAIDGGYYAMHRPIISLSMAMGDIGSWEGQNTGPFVDGVRYYNNSGMGGNMATPKLSAHDADDKTLWTGPIEAGDARVRSIAISPVAVWTDFVFVASDYGDLVAFDQRKGKELWRHTFKRGLAIRSGSTLSQDGLLYLGTHDHHLYCFEAKTGEVLWKYKTGGPIVSSACIASGIVFVGSDDGKIYAFEGSRGGK